MAGKPGRSGRQPFEISLACEAAFTRHELVGVVVKIATEAERDGDRLKAIEWLADRAWGKAEQYIYSMTDEQREARVAELLERARLRLVG